MSDHNTIQSILTALNSTDTLQKYGTLPHLIHLSPSHVPTIIYSLYTMPGYDTCKEYILRMLDVLDTPMLVSIFCHVDGMEIERRFMDKFCFLVLAVFQRVHGETPADRMLLGMRCTELKNYVLPFYLKSTFDCEAVVDDMARAPLSTLRVYEDEWMCFVGSSTFRNMLFERASSRGIGHDNRKCMYAIYKRIR